MMHLSHFNIGHGGGLGFVILVVIVVALILGGKSNAS
jgi:hypothetical protein